MFARILPKQALIGMLWCILTAFIYAGSLYMTEFLPLWRVFGVWPISAILGLTGLCSTYPFSEPKRSLGISCLGVIFTTVYFTLTLALTQGFPRFDHDFFFVALVVGGVGALQTYIYLYLHSTSKVERACCQA